LASWRLIFYRKGLKSTAKAQRRKGKKLTIFFVFTLKSFTLLCALASWRLIFHRKGVKSTAKAQRRKGKKKLFFCFYFKISCSSLRLGVLAVNLLPQRPKIYRKGAKTPRKNKNPFLVFYYQNLLLFFASWRPCG